eukprot:1751613-Amphidinium_carterae.1
MATAYHGDAAFACLGLITRGGTPHSDNDGKLGYVVPHFGWCGVQQSVNLLRVAQRVLPAGNKQARSCQTEKKKEKHPDQMRVLFHSFLKFCVTLFPLRGTSDSAKLWNPLAHNPRQYCRTHKLNDDD